MPQAKQGFGPWGEAIRYWLDERKLRQADLVKATGLRAKTISRVARGFHTQTRVLEALALALDVPFDRLLVSPLRRGSTEGRRELIRGIIEDTLRFEVVDEADEDLLSLAKRMQAFPRDVIEAFVTGLEKTQKRQRNAQRRRRKSGALSGGASVPAGFLKKRKRS